MLDPSTRSALERAVESLIDLLDCTDGDPDLEEDDPAGDPLDRGEMDMCDRFVAPTYRLDQSRGPLEYGGADSWAQLSPMGQIA